MLVNLFTSDPLYTHFSIFSDDGKVLLTEKWCSNIQQHTGGNRCCGCCSCTKCRSSWTTETKTYSNTHGNNYTT